MCLTPIKNNIIFQFVDKVDNKGQFVEETSWGLVIPGHFDTSAKTPRWGRVTDIGADCGEIAPGQWILIEALRWTEGFKFNGSTYWKTDEKQIVGYKLTEDSDLFLLRKNIVFDRLDQRVQDRKRLTVVGDVQDTPRGTILQLGPDCSDELSVGTTFYFSGDNFFNEFKHNGQKYWHINQDDVLMYEE